MSIAVLTQVYTEARRLAVAGSVVAHGDFRLKKILPTLEQVGQQAPVFAKLAETAKAVVDGPEKAAAASLLELTSLVNAVLYTQGETGLAGKLEPVATTDLGGSVAQTSARVLKPLLEALSSTGSGRLELIRDAHQRGLFRDLRLVKPALGALDDPYPDIADLMAEKVLPTFGKAILPELRAKYDPKGTKGQPRRLLLMHTIDPTGTRDLVKAALEGGSKEVKIAAIACLGADRSDLSYLIEQAAAKSQEVRHAAYHALAELNDPEAIAVLTKALAGKDYSDVADAIEQGKTPELVNVLVANIRASVDGLPKLKDKKKVTESVARVLHLLHSLPEGEFPAVDALLLDLFARREELAKIKGDNYSGRDIGETVVRVMAHGSKKVQAALVAVHATLSSEELGYAFSAGRGCLTPAKLYDTFVPYLLANLDEKKKLKDPAYAKREALINILDERYSYYYWDVDEDEDDDDPEATKTPKLDPRWLNVAVKLKRLNLINALAQPGHKAAQEFVKAEFDNALKKAKTPDDVWESLVTLFRLQHPYATEAFFAGVAKRPKKSAYYYRYYWYSSLIPKLSKDALPRLEEMLATMSDHEANYWIDAIQELRTKS